MIFWHGSSATEPGGTARDGRADEPGAANIPAMPVAGAAPLVSVPQAGGGQRRGSCDYGADRSALIWPGPIMARAGWRHAGDVGPGGEGLGAAEPEVRGGVVVSAAGENVGDLIMSGKEELNLPRRLERLHDPLSSSGRLMGVFGPVIEALVLPMLDPGHDLPLGSGVASQLVGDGHRQLGICRLTESAMG